MPLPAGPLQLAGFLMAHAFWTVSDLPADARYVPQTLCETARGERQMTSFEAESEEASLRQAEAYLEAAAPAFAACALARQAAVRLGNEPVPALVIELVEGGTPVVTVVQPFRPAAQGGFALLGDEVVMDGRGPLAPLQAAQAAGEVRAGASDHPGLGEKWTAWNQGRLPLAP